jgi:hypothetical protein
MEVKARFGNFEWGQFQDSNHLSRPMRNVMCLETDGQTLCRRPEKWSTAVTAIPFWNSDAAERGFSLTFKRAMNTPEDRELALNCCRSARCGPSAAIRTER